MAQQPLWEDLVVRGRKAARPRPGQVQAAHLAHELRAPVTSIRLGLEILTEKTQDRLREDEQAMLARAIRNTQRLEGLVNDIMDYSKIAAGKLAIVQEPCEARALIDDAVDSLQAAATAKGVRIVKDVRPLLPRASADARRIVQVLINLLSNAIKNTPAHGMITISVGEGRFEHQGTLLFKVRDTGCGIAAADLEKVFGMFEQAGGAKPVEGTGLGLTLARAMIDLHGGRIWAESAAGCGASFCFTVPIAAKDLSRPVEVYPKPLQAHGPLAEIAGRFSAFLALFI